MAKKSFLLGFGLGMLLAALILQFDFWYTQTNAKQAGDKPLTVEQLKNQATEQGYQLKTQTEIQAEIDRAKEQWEADNQDAEQKESNNKNDETSKRANDDASTNDSMTKTGTTSTERTVSRTNQQPTSVVTTGGDLKITIPSGWTASQVAGYLAQKGVVNNRQALVTELTKIYKTREVSSGTFVFKKNQDPRAVANQITNRRR